MLTQLDRLFLKQYLKLTNYNFQNYTQQDLTTLLQAINIPISQQIQWKHLYNISNNFHQFISRLHNSRIKQNYFSIAKLQSIIDMLSTNPTDLTNTSDPAYQKALQNPSQLNICGLKVSKILQELKKLKNSPILTLTTLEISKIFNNCGYNNQENIIKELFIDGFTLICTIWNNEIIKDMELYFDSNQIQIISEIGYIFLMQYYRQIFADKQKQLFKTPTKNNQLPTQFSRGTSEPQQQTPISMQQIIQTIPTLIHRETEEQQILADHIEFDAAQESFSQSEYINVSHRGSFYPQVEGLECGDSFEFEKLLRMGGSHGYRSSLMYNSDIIHEMREVCLAVPFHLLNLERLQQIKLRALKNAFTTEVDTNTWIFNVEGGRFGRDKQNNIRFPDELSISGKHAQIIFQDSFQIRDLGSKGGTYLKIWKNIMLEDGYCIQFCSEIQILFRIVSLNDQNGVFIFQFLKPQGQGQVQVNLSQKEKIRIGRSQRCRIRLIHPSIGDKHSQIYYKDKKFLFKNCHSSLTSWLRLSPKSTTSDFYKLYLGDIIRLSNKKSFIIENIHNELLKLQLQNKQKND